MPVKQIIPHSTQSFKKYFRRKAGDNLEKKSLEEIEKSTKSFLSTSEAAVILGISPSMLRKRADEYSELFPIQRVGKKYRIPKAPFIAYVRTGKTFK